MARPSNFSQPRLPRFLRDPGRVSKAEKGRPGGHRSGLVYSTYLGNAGDQGYAIALDSSANVYVTGQTISTNFPNTSGAFRRTLGGYYDAFLNTGGWKEDDLKRLGSVE